MKLLNMTLVIVLVVVTFWLLVVGQRLLLPLVIALVLWFLINLLAHAFRRVRLFGRPMPVWTSYLVSILCFIGGIWAVVELISMNLESVMRVAPAYQANLEEKLRALLAAIGINTSPNLAEIRELIDLREMLAALASTVTTLAANGGIILIYLLFLMLEQGTLDRKVTAFIGDPAKERRFRVLLRRITADVRKYIGIKTFTSTLTGVLSYAYLKVVGVELAEFWALLIFLLNFIPTVGSIVATIFPSLIALVQFDTLGPFFLVVGGIMAIQVCIGNILEPRMMGNSLNLSPMIILLNLSLWGLVWGIPGMFLCVPFLVISMIVFSHLPQTRAIAIIMSREGSLRGDDLEGAGGMPPAAVAETGQGQGQGQGQTQARAELPST